VILTNERLAGMVAGAVLALLAVAGGAVLAAETSDPWPQVTRCEVVQPEDLDQN